MVYASTRAIIVAMGFEPVTFFSGVQKLNQFSQNIFFVMCISFNTELYAIVILREESIDKLSSLSLS